MEHLFGKILDAVSSGLLSFGTAHTGLYLDLHS